MVVLVTLCGMLLLLARTGRYASAPSGAGGVALEPEKKLLYTTLWCEFAMLLVVGLVAAIGAETALAIPQINVFDFPGS